ncbi:MAG: LPP20 family lipoprotein [Pseudomonadota bacterium]|nr:LPP20 family lipoprotein [Pseudomonadota bacterium]
MTLRFKKFFTAIAVSCLVAACGYELQVVDTNSNAINPDDNPAFQQELKSYSMVSGGNVQTIPTLTAVGYAVVSTQPGKSDAQRRLMAIRAARMAAIRELAEQIHGLQVDSNTTVVDLMVQNDTFRGVVTGIIRGARTVRINPTGSDTYEIVLEIDRDVIARLIQAADRYT